MAANRVFASCCIATAVLFVFSPATVRAAGGLFGFQDRIKCIQPINEEASAPAKPKAPPSIYTAIDLNQVKYSLCYKYSILYIFAGVYLHDDGYVLAERDDAFQYVPLDAAKIAEYQAKGFLPQELPPYSIPWSAYAAGFSLWLLLGVSFLGMVGWAKFKHWWYKGKKCPRCELDLIDKDFETGVCGSCGEPVPEALRTTKPIV